MRSVKKCRRLGFVVFILVALALDELRPYHFQTVLLDDGRSIYRLFSRSGRFLWQRTISNAYGPLWTPEGNSVALVDQETYDVFTWRKGGRVQVFRDVAPSDGLLQATWSPDQTRLMFRGAGSQGSWSLDVGNVFCLDITNGKHRVFLNLSAIKAEWVGNDRIRLTLREFWEIDAKNPNAKNYRDQVVTRSLR